MSVLAQAAACEALRDDEFYGRTLDLTNCGKDYLCQSLSDMGLAFVPSYTNFILINTGVDDQLVCKYLLEDGIIARPAGSYSLPNHIRITVGTEEQNGRFIRALEKALVLIAKNGS